MEKSVRPDRKYFVKTGWISLTVTGVLLLITGILNLVFFLTSTEPVAFPVTWIVAGGLLVILWAIVYPLILLWIRNLEYVVYDDRVSIHKGILTKTIQNIPFRAITDFALVRTLYDRALKIGSIKIQTAGKSVQSSASQYEGVLGGLADYETLHAELRSRIRILHPVSEPSTTTESPRPSQDYLLQEILKELKEIRKGLKS